MAAQGICLTQALSLSLSLSNPKLSILASVLAISAATVYASCSRAACLTRHCRHTHHNSYTHPRAQFISTASNSTFIFFPFFFRLLIVCFKLGQVQVHIAPSSGPTLHMCGISWLVVGNNILDVPGNQEQYWCQTSYNLIIVIWLFHLRYLSTSILVSERHGQQLSPFCSSKGRSRDPSIKALSNSLPRPGTQTHLLPGWPAL